MQCGLGPQSKNVARKRLVFDLEANGLHDATTVWCMAATDIDTREKFFFGPDKIEDGVRLLESYDELIGHNIVEFDLPCLSKLTSFDIDKIKFVTDTLILSRLLNPDRKAPASCPDKSKPHSLDTWGYRVGMGKKVHEDWSQYSEDMKQRCVGDVDITCLTYQFLLVEMEGHNWAESIQIEHDVARIMAEQERNGVYFDIEAARAGVLDLENKIKEIDDKLFPLLPVRIKQYGTEVKKPYLKNGDYSKMVTSWYGDSLETGYIAGPFTRIDFEEFNLNSDVQVKQFLIDNGWNPVSWNYNNNGEQTSPKLEFSESGTDGIKGDTGSLIKERKLWSHRKSQIEGWIKNVREDQTLPAGANPCGTNTGRMRHRLVVNVPKAKKYVPYGYEMRSYFAHRPDRILVGYDGKSLELRMLAHYMGDEEFSEEVVNGKEEDGTDVHSKNRERASLPNRDAAKTFIYAFNYGAGDEKLGSIAGGGRDEGAELRKQFLANCPSLDKLIKNVKRASGRGYLVGLDGRKLWMRRSDDGRIQRNKALNTLLQSAGSIVMKKAMVILDKSVKEYGLDALKVIDMHDEAQWDVAPKDKEKFIELAKDAMVKAGIHFNLRVPLEADVKVGHNWAETH